jgi:RNA polymerase sigma-70 factor, ECF subfamily
VLSGIRTLFQGAVTVLLGAHPFRHAESTAATRPRVFRAVLAPVSRRPDPVSRRPGPGFVLFALVSPPIAGTSAGHGETANECNLLPRSAVSHHDGAGGESQVSDDLEAREAVRGAYQAYYRRLVATLYGLTGDHSEAQDLVQEAYARALARPRVFLDVADPEAWLRTVAVNLARTRWRRRRLLDTMVRTGRIAPSPESVPAINADRVLLVNALQKLSRATRETIVLHHLADMSVHEVAEQLGVPVGTVKARLSRGRALLADLIGDRETAATTIPAPRQPVPRAAAPARPPAPVRSLATAVDGDHD